MSAAKQDLWRRRRSRCRPTSARSRWPSTSPGVDSLNLDAETIADIFNGTITKWNDPAIAQANPGTKLPSTTISTVHRSDDSGTTYNFTDYLNKAGNGAWSDAPNSRGRSRAPRADRASTAPPASSGPSPTPTGSIGYADDCAVTAAGPSASPRSRSAPTTTRRRADGAAQMLELSPPAPGRPATSMATDIDRTSTAKGDYPLMLVSYLMACPKYSDSGTADLVKGYLTYVVSSEGQQAAPGGCELGAAAGRPVRRRRLRSSRRSRPAADRPVTGTAASDRRRTRVHLQGVHSDRDRLSGAGRP